MSILNYQHDADFEGAEPAGLNLKTLVAIRWTAVAGQIATVMVVAYMLNFALPIAALLAGIAILVGSNLYLGFGRRGRRWLTVRRATWVLGFDILQLAFLLGLTGGLLNPFVVLMLAPVAVSATILTRNTTLKLCVLDFAAITWLAFWHLPLPWAGSGIALSPIYVLGSWTAMSVALVFIAAYVWTASDEARRLSSALAKSEAALAKERELSSLGALAAAAAHELGSPLATIAVVAKELSLQVPPGSDLAEDIDLLRSQSDRCRDILHQLEERPPADGGEPFHLLSLTALVETAAEDHLPDEIDFDILAVLEQEGPEPEVPRSPEFLNGIGNLISNAGQFARTRVEVRVGWNAKTVTVVVQDDGPGFPNSVLRSAGEPYISTRAGVDGHMGLGIFVATTLLEGMGATVSYENAGGARVNVVWPRSKLASEADAGVVGGIG